MVEDIEYRKCRPTKYRPGWLSTTPPIWEQQIASFDAVTARTLDLPLRTRVPTARSALLAGHHAQAKAQPEGRARRAQRISSFRLGLVSPLERGEHVGLAPTQRCGRSKLQKVIARERFDSFRAQEFLARFGPRFSRVVLASQDEHRLTRGWSDTGRG
jgi:hypothetical protein